MDFKALVPRQTAVPQITASSSGCPADSPMDVDDVPTLKDGFESRRGCSEFEQDSHGEVAPRALSQQKLSPIFRPPPALLDEQESLQFTF